MSVTDIPYYLLLKGVKGLGIKEAELKGASKFISDFGTDVKSVDDTVNFIINSGLTGNKKKAEEYLDYMNTLPQQFKENSLSKLAHNMRSSLFRYNDCFNLKLVYLDDNFNKGYKIEKVPYYVYSSFLENLLC